MTFSERKLRWNRFYDGLPEEWRFQFLLWPLLAVGTVNMLLTVATGFPFALLVLLGVIFVTAVRLPYALGLSAPSGEDRPARPVRIEGYGWLTELNQSYDALPEARRIWVYPAVLLIAGAINMLLTINYGFPFGLLFLFALLALIAFRAPYTAGWLAGAETTEMDAGDTPALAESGDPPPDAEAERFPDDAGPEGTAQPPLG